MKGTDRDMMENVKENVSDRRQNISLKCIFCTLLCCVIFCKNAVITVFAADTYQVSVNGVVVDSTNAADVLGDGTVSYDNTTNTLSLTDAALESITNDAGTTFTIQLSGQNSITRISSSGAEKLIDSASALVINGSGTLELSGMNESDFIQCVAVDGAVTVDGVRLKMVNAYDGGIVSSGDIAVLNHAEVTGNAGNLFRATSGKLTITDSTVKAPDGNGEITGWNAVWVRDMELTNSVLEIEAPSQAVYASGNMVIHNSDITVESQSIPGEIGLWADGTMTITESTVKAESFNHIPIYAGADLSISGGSIEAVTSHTSAAALQSGSGSINITGPVTVSTTTVGGTVCKAKNDIIIRTSLAGLESKHYEVYAGETPVSASQVNASPFIADTDVTTDIGTNAYFRIDEHPHVYAQETIKDAALISAADCINAAVYFKSCTCGQVSTNNADVFVFGTPAGHKTIHHEAVEPNCSAMGNVEYWECGSCNKYFNNETATTEIKLENTVIDKAPDRHISDGSGWYFDKDTHWKNCVCGLVLDNVTHTFTWVIDKEPQEHVNGLKHEECSVCGYAKAGIEIPASGTTTKPTEPEEPTNPTEPTNPSEPSQPEEPTNPSEPSQPEEPTNPSEPSQPQEPDESIEADEQDEEAYEETTGGTASPGTGDNSNTAFWLVLSVFAGVGLTVMLNLKEEKREKR